MHSTLVFLGQEQESGKWSGGISTIRRGRRLERCAVTYTRPTQTEARLVDFGVVVLDV